jgi:hypothetical protein
MRFLNLKDSLPQDCGLQVVAAQGERHLATASQ